MAKRYKYNGSEYSTIEGLRQAIWLKEHKIFGVIESDDGWGTLGVEVFEYEAPKVDDLVYREKTEEKMRAKRDALLSASDFYLMSDYPSDEEGLNEVKAYRQLLRDLTKQEGWPDSIVWPELPKQLRG